MILAILIAMLVSVVALVQRKAQQCRAETDVNALVQAVLHYQQVYGTWPGVATPQPDLCVAGNASLAGTVTGASSTNTDLATVIAALDPGSSFNPRQILFLTTPTHALVNGLSDPWGQPYLLVMGAQQHSFQYSNLAFSNLSAFAVSAGAPAASTNLIFSAGAKP